MCSFDLNSLVFNSAFKIYSITRFSSFAVFQFIYTTIFGAYSAYLFVRTGHFVPSFLAHVFCNIMGLADIMEIVSLPEPRRSITAAIFVIGFISWCYLLSPLTSPALYSNNLFWADSLSWRSDLLSGVKTFLVSVNFFYIWGTSCFMFWTVPLISFKFTGFVKTYRRMFLLFFAADPAWCLWKLS